jgi:WhiB family redox-sensing transcriptional regulator
VNPYTVTPYLRVYAFEPAEAPEDLTWQDQALCAQADPEAWFPEKGGSTRDPKRVCWSCEVRAECLGYALEHDERFGVWGALSERERRRLKNRFGDDIAAAVESTRPPNPQSTKAVA